MCRFRILRTFAYVLDSTARRRAPDLGGRVAALACGADYCEYCLLSSSGRMHIMRAVERTPSLSRILRRQ